MPSPSIDLVLRGYEAFNRRDIEGALAGFDPDIVWIGPAGLPEGEREFLGHDGVKRFWSMWHESFTEFRVEVEEVFEHRDAVVAFVRLHGLHAGSGVEVVTPELGHVWTISDGAAVRMEMFPDRAAAFAHAGVERD